MERETLKLALEALETGKPMFDAYWGGSQFDNAITAIKEVLAQPEQEPDYYGLTSDHLWMSITKDHYNKLKPEFRMACYTTPPQRSWVELEGEEIRNLWEEATKPDRSTVTMVTSFARAIEAKLKEKNNGT